ncbi:hypothetical protein AMJ86_08765 [bacterium SM23_57]|nr:MAG: hypothetical protein AMJ86_08765 [bacterium SM23_57]
METRELPWFTYLQVLFRWRKFYIITFFGVCLIAAIISLILPKYYQSTATILPPVSSTGFEALIPDEVRNFFGGFAGESAEAVIYLAILDSRTIKEKLIDQFNLAEVYKFKESYYIEDLLIAVEKRVKVEYDGENPLSVSVTDRSPERAAEMANFIVNELDKTYQEMNNRRAAFNRQFLGERVAETRVTLELYEDSLKTFQEKHQAISLPEQATAAIGVAADLVAQMMSLDVQIQVLKASVQPDHPELKTLMEQRRGIKDQLTRLTKTNPDQMESDTPFPGLEELPELRTQFMRLYREVEIQSKLLEFLIPQYEQARIQEVRDTPTVTILDEGRIPTKRVKPVRKKIVIVAGLLTLIVCTIIVSISEYFQRIKATEQSTYQSLNGMITQVKNDIPFMKKSQKNPDST